MGETSILNKLIKHMQDKDNNPFLSLVDEYLIKRGKSPNRLREYRIPIVPRDRPSGRIGASTVGGCKRQGLFTYLGVRGKRKTDPDTELKFEDGNWRHHKWQAMFLDMQEVLGKDKFKVLGIEQQIEIPKLKIVGHLDAAIQMGEWGRAVVDIKGINEYGFGYVVHHHEPKVEHALQIHSYIKGRGLKRGILLYDNKNNQLTKVLTVDFDRATWLNVEGWCNEVLRYLKDRSLPPKHRECDHGSFLWDRCPYAWICFSGKSDATIKKFAYKDVESKGDANGLKQTGT